MYEGRLRELSEAASKGPWEEQVGSEGDWEHGHFSYVEGVVIGAEKERPWVIRFEDDYGTDQSANSRLIVFQRNTADQMADLVEAARESLKHGSHEGECDFDGDPYGSCVVHVDTSQLRDKRLRAAIVALDTRTSDLTPEETDAFERVARDRR